MYITIQKQAFLKKKTEKKAIEQQETQQLLNANRPISLN